jgi:ABC-type multidrug transport system fused ATPase/permease subunit
MLSNDMNELIQNYLSPLMAVFTNLFTIIIYGVSMVMFVDPLIAVIIIGISILMTFVPELTSRKLSVLYNAYLARLGKYTTQVNSYYLAKVFLDKREIKAISDEHYRQVDQMLDANMKYRKNNSLAMVLNGGSVEAISCIAFAITAIQLFQGRIIVGMASAAFLYATKFMNPLYEFNVNIGRVKSTKEMQEKFLAILEANTVNKETSDTIDSLAIRDVTKEFDSKSIVYQNYLFSGNKKYLVIGKNGAGKSTMLAILTGILKPDHGHLYKDGREVSDNLLDAISYLPQQSIIFPTSYLSNVTVYGAYPDEHLKEYEEMFPEDIIQSIKKNPDMETLSGGEKQVVCILRVLCSGKKFIIMDEPFSGMSPACIDRFMEYLPALPYTMIVTVHNLNEYKDSFDEIIDLG